MNTLVISTKIKSLRKILKWYAITVYAKKYFQFKKGNKQGNKKEMIYHPLEKFLRWPTL